MTRSNKLSELEYVIAMMQWSILEMILYRNIVFRTIHGLSLAWSRGILWGMLLFLVSLGTLLSWNRFRNRISVATTTSLPFIIYTLISFWKSVHVLFYVFISVGVALSIAYLVLLWSRGNNGLSKAKLKRRIWKSFVSVRNIIVTSLAVIPIIIGISFMFSSGYAAAKTTPKYSGDENKLANNIEIVSKLDNEIWPGLSTKEKLEVLQTVANVEARYLGLPHELNVQLGALQEDNLASYDDRSHIITISVDHIEFSSPEEILDSLCHECYHAHQRRACDAYDTMDDEYKELLEFYNLQVYEREFADYVSGEENEEKYYNQLVERHARAYGAMSVEDYYEQINKYLGKKATDTETKHN